MPHCPRPRAPKPRHRTAAPTTRLRRELEERRCAADWLKGGRVVFNIGGNKYRVIVAIRYTQQIAWVRFVGTHAQYDQVDAETI
ncbi:type II toxin-antitoxin system HigB family toxin [Halomonas sp.]|uniref:type II toxin-antitoxin system HigB family toxin n=1 Tax=Halomonas sp. TaxID=1486246 RepID=UPI00261A458F|nr:type II toxin-antitoxin system HigB family toxin [Halomonas sp.]